MTPEQRKELDAYKAANPEPQREKSFTERAIAGNLTESEINARRTLKAKLRRRVQFSGTPRSL